MIDLTTSALHGDRFLAKALTTNAAWARRAVGLDPDDVRPVIAVVASARAQTLVPLRPAEPEHWVSLETQRFIKDVSLATNPEESARVGHDWLAHGAIRPLVIGEHPLGHINERWTLRPDTVQRRNRSLLPHRSETDVRATAQGNVETLVPGPDVDIELHNDCLWATRGGNTVRITHARAREAIAQLGKGARQTDNGLLTLIARFGEMGIAVARSSLTRGHASAWARIGVTPTQAAQNISRMEVALVDVRSAPCTGTAPLRNAFAALGIRTRSKPADAAFVWILVDDGADTRMKLAQIEQALLGPDTNWALCSITTGAITITTGRGTQPGTLGDEALAHVDGAADVAPDPEHLVATALSAVAHSPCTGTRTRLRIPHGTRSQRRKQTLRLIAGRHWPASRTELLRRTLESIEAAAASSAESRLPILLTKNIGETPKLEAGLDGNESAWGIVLEHWTGWTIIVRTKGYGGPCPQCIALRLNNASWGSTDIKCPHPEISDHDKAMPADQIAAAIVENTTRTRPEATLTWLDPPGRRLAPDEPLGAQYRCSRCTHRNEPTYRPRRAPRHGAWAGSITASQAIDGEPLTARSWAHVHRTRRSLRWAHATGLAGSAADMNPEGARMRAEHEAAERHAIEWHEGQHRIGPRSTRAVERAGIRHVTPAALARFSETQYKQRESINGAGYRHVRVPVVFDATQHHTPIYWCMGTDLSTEAREEVWVPEEWTFIGAPPPLGASTDRTVNRRFCVADTNGCASGPSPEAAAAQAFSELVERDARALWWYTRAILPEIVIEESGDPWLSSAPQRYEAIGRTIRVLDATTTANINVSIAVSRRKTPLRDGSWDPVISSGAGTSTVAASRAALREHIHNGPRRSDSHQSWYARSKAPECQTLRRLGPEEAPWLEGTTGCVPVSKPAHMDEMPRLDQALSAAYELKASLIAIDLTLSPLDPIVVRVASPELCHPWHRLGQPRLSIGARDAGWTNQTFDEQELNPVPLVM